jgi:hypothetical protein
MKADLLGPQPTRLEQILVDDIAVCYLAARHAEIRGACSFAGAQARK